MSNIRSWGQSGYPYKLEYSPDAMEQVRQLAIEGLLMLPRVGLGVGGLLLGQRDAKVVRILDSVPIPCAHASGPSFLLSDEEIADASAMVQAASPLTVVGWYCSKTRGPAAFTDNDAKVFAALCPEPWQIMVLIKPSTIDETKALLCFRDRAGKLTTGPERPLPVFIAPLAEPQPGEVKAEEKIVPDTKSSDQIRPEPSTTFPIRVALVPGPDAEKWVDRKKSGGYQFAVAMAVVVVLCAMGLLIYSR